MNDLSDIKIDFGTGRVVIDTTTGDAALIYGADVVLQSLAIRFRTQLGTVKRQGLDTFGWDFVNQIKGKIKFDSVSSIANELTRLAFLDPNVKDCNVETDQQSDQETVLFDIRVTLTDNLVYSLTFAI